MFFNCNNFNSGKRIYMLDSIFGAYALHEQMKEDKIQEIINSIEYGQDNLVIEWEDYFSDNDKEYIINQVCNRLGVYIK